MLANKNQENQQDWQEIEKLETLIDESLVKIEALQEELKDLEADLSTFLDRYYGSASVFFKNNSNDQQADNDNTNLDQERKNIYKKIAKVCSKDNFSFADNHAHSDLLKIEGYLNDGTEQSLSPQDLLSNLAFEYYSLIQQMHELKNKKQTLLESPAYELRQQVIWANIKTSETISKIREDITNQVNSPS